MQPMQPSTVVAGEANGFINGIATGFISHIANALGTRWWDEADEGLEPNITAQSERAEQHDDHKHQGQPCRDPTFELMKEFLTISTNSTSVSSTWS